MKMVDEGEEKVTSPKGKKLPSVILFGNHLALFLACFLPVIHLVTTKNCVKWVSLHQTSSNYISHSGHRKAPENLDFPGLLRLFDCKCAANYLLGKSG